MQLFISYGHDANGALVMRGQACRIDVHVDADRRLALAEAPLSALPPPDQLHTRPEATT